MISAVESLWSSYQVRGIMVAMVVRQGLTVDDLVGPAVRKKSRPKFNDMRENCESK